LWEGEKDGLNAMEAKRKKVLMIAGAVVALIVMAAIVSVLLFDINSYKTHFETAASEATGLDVMINGKMGLSFFPFGISAHDVHVDSKKGEILSLEKLKLGVAFIPLLKKQLKVISCELVKPAATIVKDADGEYNFGNSEKKWTEDGPGTAFSLKKLRLSRGTMVYFDKKTGEKTELKEITLLTRDLSLVDFSGNIIKNLSFTGNLDCGEVRKKDLKIYNIKSPVKMENGVISLMSLTMDIFDAKAEGDVTADKSEVDAVYKINLKVSKLDFEKLQESFGAKKVIGGKGDLVASLVLKEKGSRTLMSSMDGTFSLRGDNLVIYTMDLDKVLSSYETSQEFNLVDLGAFFIAGPLGTVALRGYRYGDVYYQTWGGQGVITQFISHWKIEDGVADATDCALATLHNRIALKGRLNLVSERYDNVTVALLDEKGCAKFEQSIVGSFGSPQIGAVSAVASLTGPITDFYKKAKRFFQVGSCEVFYNGSVRQP
jgi:uncharacterized protein involved in outer membrane biogenesis